MSGIPTAWGFRATQNGDGSLTVHDVPVFCVCERGRHAFTEKWLDAALERMQRDELNGYMPPMHVRHHGKPEKEPVAAGVFRITRKAPVRLRRGTRPGLLADLIITNPAVAADVLAKRLPYRSVEIFDVNETVIDTLALLDHEAPFLELPMTVVREVVQGRELAGVGPSVTPATFQLERGDLGDGVVCSFRRERSVYLLMEANMPEDSKEKGGGEGKGKESKGEGGGPDVSAVVKAIESGTITIADFAAIKAAMEAAESKAGGEKEVEEKPEMTGAEAPPPAAAMKRDGGVSPEQFAKVAAEARAARAEVETLKAERTRESEVDAAMVRLKDRALGSDLRVNLLAFHRDHGSAAFGKYVSGLEAAAPAIKSGGQTEAERFAAARADFPASALKYEGKGADSVERAAKFAREWKSLSEAGLVKMPEDRYVEINMQGGIAALK